MRISIRVRSPVLRVSYKHQKNGTPGVQKLFCGIFDRQPACVIMTPSQQLGGQGATQSASSVDVASGDHGTPATGREV